MKGRNSCPLCKLMFFSLPTDEDATFGAARREQVTAALRASGLTERDANIAVQRYGARTPTISEMQRAAAHASHYLAQDLRPIAGSRVEESGSSELLSVSGLARISVDYISANFITMSNLIPALAAAQGRAYSQQQAQEWKLLLTHLWTTLKEQDGKKIDALVLAAKLRKELKTRMKKFYSDVDYIDFFFTYSDPTVSNPCFDDLELLLNYITLRCWMAQREEEEANVAKLKEAKTKRREARTEPKKQISCVVM